MGHKIKPESLRIGIIKPWHARWFIKGGFGLNLEEDEMIRKTVKKRLNNAGIVNIDIERESGEIKIYIKSARPGLVIGRGGQGIDDLGKEIKKELRKLYCRRSQTNIPAIKLIIEELKRTEISATNIAQNIVNEIEKRMPYRRVLKKYLDSALQNRNVKGAKIQLAGRLNGAEIARKEWLSKGSLPLQTLRADIDYGEETAFTTYGTIGIKVWLYKGEVFE